MNHHLEALPGAPALTDEGRPSGDPFGIDGPEYSDRDREMFVLGYEFHGVCRHAGGVSSHTIHAANRFRVESALAAAGVDFRTVDLGDGWCRIKIL
jgi:hypothetical protein